MTTPSVSVIAPINAAIERVKDVLFRPFSASKWFTIGFCAWLASLGRSGFNFNFGHQQRNVSREQLRETLWRIHDYVLGHLYWIVPVAIVLVLCGLAAWVVFTWLNSRGAFMFLHCVARNRAEISEPWRRFRAEGNSLLVFRLVIGLVSLAVLLPLVIAAGVKILAMALHDAWGPAGIWNLVGLGLALVAAMLVFGLIAKLTNDFVVAVMFLRGRGCLRGWAEVGRLLAAHPLRFIGYFLFQIVLAVAIVVVIVVAVIATCCIAGCLLVLPYLGIVLLLPVLVFTRSYSLYYLAQYGPEYDVFRPAEPAPIAPASVPAPPVR